MSKLPEHLQICIVKDRPPEPGELLTMRLGPANWLNDPAAWSRDEFLA